MEKKPKRRTRERILETSLTLFNALGEPNVTTAAIADELDISPGNLYYHFHSKDEILDALFVAFEHEMAEKLATPTERAVHVEDIWLFLHLLFEAMSKYRFIYRDLAELVTKNRTVETHFRRILGYQVKTAAAICEGLVARGEMRATPSEIQALAVNVIIIATYWPSFDYVSDPRRKDAGNDFGRGAFQVMSLAAPFLQGRARELLQNLSHEYLAGDETEPRQPLRAEKPIKLH